VEGSQKKDDAHDYSNITIEEHVRQYIEQGYGRMDAMKLAAKDRGISKRDIYGLLNK